MTSAPLEGELEITGRIMPASNATFLGTLAGESVVYKPMSGEQPLWDFPEGQLARREVAAFEVSEVLGWDTVPATWMGQGPHGPGMVQRWCDVDPAQDAVDLVPTGQLPDGWRHVFDGYDGQDRPISLVHEDSVDLRHMAVFDLIVNNADRKGGHVLEMASGHRYGIDHGLTFHHEHKLRTILWGWMDEPLTDDEIDGVQRVRDEMAGDLGQTLDDLLTVRDVGALAARCDRILRDPRFPAPRGDMPPIPWPPF